MAVDLEQIIVKDAATIRDDILRALRNGLIRRGVSNPNVTPGSDDYVRATAIANELVIVEANVVIASDQNMLDTCGIEKLAQAAAPFGLAQRPAGGSAGSIVLESTASTTVVAGAELLDGSGLRYAVTVGGIYSDGDLIPIQALDTGEATNLEADSVLRWQSAPPFASTEALVSSGGLINGVDEEGVEAFRARFFAFLATAPVSGNASHTIAIAEQSDPSVQKAFCFPAVQGPATVHVAVAAAPTDTNKSREVDTSKLNSTVRPYIAGAYPEHVHLVVTTVNDVNADVAFALTIPEAPTASPAGPGGGWLDGTPWPVPSTTAPMHCDVTAVTSSTVFTVNSSTAPVALANGTSRISWLSPTDWKLYTAQVVSFTGTGPYTITIDTPFPNIAVGCLIWPQFAFQQDVVDAVLESFELLGCGEKSANAFALIRGYRRPRPSASWPSQIGGAMLRAVSAASDLIQDVSYLRRYDGTTTVNGSSGTMTPAALADGDVEDPPNIYVPRHLAFYRTET